MNVINRAWTAAVTRAVPRWVWFAAFGSGFVLGSLFATRPLSWVHTYWQLLMIGVGCWISAGGFLMYLYKDSLLLSTSKAQVEHE